MLRFRLKLQLPERFKVEQPPFFSFSFFFPLFFFSLFFCISKGRTFSGQVSPELIAFKCRSGEGIRENLRFPLHSNSCKYIQQIARTPRIFPKKTQKTSSGQE